MRTFISTTAGIHLCTDTFLLKPFFQRRETRSTSIFFAFYLLCQYISHNSFTQKTLFFHHLLVYLPLFVFGIICSSQSFCDPLSSYSTWCCTTFNFHFLPLNWDIFFFFSFTLHWTHQALTGWGGVDSDNSTARRLPRACLFDEGRELGIPSA